MKKFIDKIEHMNGLGFLLDVKGIEINPERLPDNVIYMKDENILRFDGGEFKAPADCIESIKGIIPVPENDNVLNKTLAGYRAKSVDVTKADFELMRKYMANPDRFSMDDFRVYKSYLAHNFVDRDRERFSAQVLKSFVKTLPGRALLYGHDWGGTGEGRFFDAKLVKMSIDEVIDFVGGHPDKTLKKQLAKIEKKDGAIYWLVAKYYVLATDTEKVDKIDSGIMRDMSIGFRAPILDPVKTPDGDGVEYWEYQNADTREAEALEGSLVFLGSQYGAGTRKVLKSALQAYNPAFLSFSDNDLENICKVLAGEQVPEFNNVTDNKNSKEVNTMAKQSITIDYEVKEKKFSKTLLIGSDESQDAVKNAVIEAVKSAVDIYEADAVKSTDQLTAVQNELDQIKGVFGESYSIERVKALAEMETAVKAEKAAEALRLGQLAKIIPTGDEGQKRLEFMQKLPVSEIQHFIDDYKAIYEKSNPPDGKFNPDTPDNAENAKPKGPNRFQAPVNISVLNR